MLGLVHGLHLFTGTGILICVQAVKHVSKFNRRLIVKLEKMDCHVEAMLFLVEFSGDLTNLLVHVGALILILVRIAKRHQHHCVLLDHTEKHVD